VTVICFVDVETTGREVSQPHELWEIGLIRREFPSSDAEQVATSEREYAWQVFPNLRDAEPGALRIGKFYQRCKPLILGHGHVLTHPRMDDPVDEEPFPEDPMAYLIAAELARLLDGAIFVAINVAFDAGFVAKFLRTYGQAPTWDYHLVEALSLGAGHLHLPPPWESRVITDGLGVDTEKDRHTGLGDARIVRAIYDTVFATADPDRAALPDTERLPVL
jgi:DNA polymerase III epsilon subunit-like protein